MLLNYGVSFDLAAATNQEGPEFKGALDALFDSQRSRLPAQAAAYLAQALQEEAAREAEAAMVAEEGKQK